MTDIVERLSPLGMRGVDGTGLSIVEIDIEVLNLAIAEIMRLRTALEQLRSVTGQATAAGQSFADIKQDIRK